MQLNLSIGDLLALVINQSQAVTTVAEAIKAGNPQVTLNSLGSAIKRLNEVSTAFAGAVEAETQKQQGVQDVIAPAPAENGHAAETVN